MFAEPRSCDQLANLLPLLQVRALHMRIGTSYGLILTAFIC